MTVVRSVESWLKGWRHIAYRMKVKYVLESRAHGLFRDKAWPLATAVDGLKEIYRHEEPLFDGFPDGIDDPFARDTFLAENRTCSIHPDLVLEASGDILIEPKHSLAMIDRRRFIEATRGSAHKIMTPPLSAKWKGRGSAIQRVESIIHLDGLLGTNLFHFIADALNPFLLLDECGNVDMTQPVLIHRRIVDVPFVRDLMGLPCFAKTNWLVQDRGQYIATRKLTKGVASYAQFAKSYRSLASLVDKRPHRRVFLDRRPRYQRRLTNMDRVAPILARNGFETVFAEDLTYLEQARLFAETSHFVGLHGAGLTNLLFCDIPNTKVLEITSSGLMNPHFYWMCNVLGIKGYDVIAGTDFDINWNYSIDPAQFERRLEALVA